MLPEIIFKYEQFKSSLVARHSNMVTNKTIKWFLK